MVREDILLCYIYFFTYMMQSIKGYKFEKFGEIYANYIDKFSRLVVWGVGF